MSWSRLPCVKADDADGAVSHCLVAEGSLVLASAVGGAMARLAELADLAVFDAQARVAGRGGLLYALHVIKPLTGGW
ncbi:hypothetical protein [Escherichia coli]|uniref:hypothetical protein n=1 Tax=Escherichia coli TaxID=562 RepID=UPI0021C5E651|nr:hypothetical protein [Escherichia coli]UVF01884.1 hypothetical protein KW498_25795 [Escherichia coli]